MKRVISRSLFVIALSPAFVFTLPGQAYSQHNGGSFEGRGRVASGVDRASREAGHQPGNRDELKPMVTGKFLRDIESLERQCLIEVNRMRKAKGLPALEFSEDLLAVARYYSQRMAQEKFFAHEDPEGRTVRQRVTEAGIRWRVLGENLAYTNGYINPVAASMSGWMGSAGHRRNILDPDYRKTAIGAWISADGTIFFTEIFLR